MDESIIDELVSNQVLFAKAYLIMNNQYREKPNEEEYKEFCKAMGQAFLYITQKILNDRYYSIRQGPINFLSRDRI